MVVDQLRFLLVAKKLVALVAVKVGSLCICKALNRRIFYPPTPGPDPYKKRQAVESLIDDLAGYRHF
jgi:hypothetical protein